MQVSEFDRFADEYQDLHARNVRASGETPEYFAEYKVTDVARALGCPDDVDNILDFGGGIGSSVRHFRRHFARSTLTCLDVSKRSLGLARARYGSAARFVAFDGQTIPFGDASFDLAFAACVFHHIDGSEHEHLQRELHRIVRPGGSLFIFEHNPYNPLTRHAVNTCPFDENAILIAGRKTRETMARAGFRRPVLRYRLFFPRALSKLRIVEPYLQWLPLGAQYYVWGKKH